MLYFSNCATGITLSPADATQSFCSNPFHHSFSLASGRMEKKSEGMDSGTEEDARLICELSSLHNTSTQFWTVCLVVDKLMVMLESQPDLRKFRWGYKYSLLDRSQSH